MYQNDYEIMFSVIICCFNSEKFIKKTIDSVINQSFKNFEIIIVNDGSTDKTEKHILDYRKKYNYIKYFRQKNNGYSAARNLAIENCNTNWVVILDHDDTMFPDRLKIHYENILKNPNKKIFFGNCKIINDKSMTNKFEYFYNKNKYIPVDFNHHNDYFYLLIRYGCFIPSSTLAINKDLFNEYKFNEHLKVIADYDFFLKVAQKNIFFAIDENLITYNSHPNQISNRFKILEKKELIQLFIKFFSKKNKFSYKMIILLSIIKNLTLYIKYKIFYDFRFNI